MSRGASLRTGPGPPQALPTSCRIPSWSPRTLPAPLTAPPKPTVHLKLLWPDSALPAGLACWKSRFEAQPQKACHSPAEGDAFLQFLLNAEWRGLTTRDMSQSRGLVTLSNPGPPPLFLSHRTRATQRLRFNSQLSHLPAGRPRVNH